MDGHDAEAREALRRYPPPGRSRRLRHLRHTSPHRAAVQPESRRTSGRTTACARPGCRRSERLRCARRRPRCAADSPLPAVKCSRWNAGFRPDSGLSRGGPSRSAIRPPFRDIPAWALSAKSRPGRAACPHFPAAPSLVSGLLRKAIEGDGAERRVLVANPPCFLELI